ncbi:MAG: DEAD/DEAH box helicase [Bacteroidetes bacterium]|nr:DEAD/DEAH box helicase [Bacteroidota bacterium]
MNTFKDFDLQEVLLDKLDKIEYIEPTPIQAQTIPIALKGKDVFGSAQTGTGKTAAFILPLLSHIISQPNSAALILVPTRELAMQVMDFAKTLLSNRNRNKIALLIGGQPIFKQLSQLRFNPNLIVGTPGRINDHISRRTLKLNNVKYFVLDEADRMLDMGFTEELEKITNLLPKDRQTLMFSATIPKDIISIANKYLQDPERIAIGEAQTPALKVKQETVFVKKDNKFKILTEEITKREGSIIIFAKTKIGTEKLANKLAGKFKVEYIHGDLRQGRRDRVIKSFKNSKYRILVATDVAARGLDIPHIEHVINYDIPQCPEDYIHRIGRTGRAGKEGSALGIISCEDKPKWKAINYFIETGKKEPIKKNSSKRRKSFGSDRRRSSFSDRKRSSFRGNENRGGDNRRSENRGGGDNRRKN